VAKRAAIPNRVELRLPSGKACVVAATLETGGPIASDGSPKNRFFGRRLFRAIEKGRLEVAIEGQAVGELDDLSLADYHAIRDAAFRAGAIALEDDDGLCRNCEAPLVARREDAPFDDLDVWYEGAEPAPASPFRLPDPEPLFGKRAVAIEMAPRTVRDAKPLWRALGGETGLRITSGVAKALGVHAIVYDDGEKELDPKRIARMLDRTSDRNFALVETLFVLLNYSSRGRFPRVCDECGTLHELDAPPVRELAIDPDALRWLEAGMKPPERASFPTFDEFERRTERIAEEVYEKRKVRNLPLYVSPDVPPVDTGGEPLLGSYEPSTAIEETFAIHLYYRSFEKMYGDEPYDVDEEIRDTIDHEVEHHLYYLAGHDPMDEEERAEAAADLRRVYGDKAAKRARRRAVASELRTAAIFVAILIALAGVAAVFVALSD
jgi:hypothetical protein